MIYLTGLVLLPYLTFVFVSEGIDPFHKPSGSQSKRLRWRLGRKLALSVFLGLACFGLLSTFTSLGSIVGLIVSGCVTVLMAAFYLLRRHHHVRIQ